MLPPPFRNALVLTGPTGSGKTQFALELASRLNAEIISMDSMAVYRRMDIGTAKPTIEQRAQVAHHLVDLLEPWESASVAWWLEQATRCAADIEARGRQVLFVGGTPLYLKALLCGLFDGPPANPAIRLRLATEAESLGCTVLHDRLAAVDPTCAARLHPNDVRRTIRALEVYELTGKPMSGWQTQWPADAAGSRQPAAGSNEAADSLLPAVCCLLPARQELYDRINRRVEDMFAAGLVEEVKQLRAMERPLSLEARQALGYKEVFDLLDGRMTQEETIVRVQTRSRNFAKRQIAWFRHLPDCQPVTMELTQALWRSKMNA